jgi:hypothetical protein
MLHPGSFTYRITRVELGALLANVRAGIALSSTPGAYFELAMFNRLIVASLTPGAGVHQANVPALGEGVRVSGVASQDRGGQSGEEGNRGTHDEYRLWINVVWSMEYGVWRVEEGGREKKEV